MLVGVPREVKNHEYRVAITPAGVVELVRRGHEVLIEAGAGHGSAIPDAEFAAAGARIAAHADDVWGAAELVLKVKEPVAEEFHRMRPGQVLFAYLHLAANAECTRAIVAAGVDAIAYETVQLPDGSLPLLAPMSEVAGRMATQVGARCLERTQGGRGVLLGGVPGVPAGKVAVLGAGVAGMNAAAIALGFRADVVVLDTNVDRLRQVDFAYRGDLRTVAGNSYEVAKACRWADLVIGAVLVPGAKAPTLVDNDLVATMRPGSVLVDVAIDQGGCFADSRPTTHDAPTFRVHESVFYCVANMPGAVPHTSTWALTNVTLPYVIALADKGFRRAVGDDPALARGVNAVRGTIALAEVARAHGLPHVPLAQS
ncbi:alanine dehydrogenase [Saccharothrix australiensis]|uniref:Alanine dehydrogenase n=1 Tax=Saccharothrix australiensis TaxID=2072 RepID=A0A495W4M6_9PSEU|nr:alanine dehydrogenase [Saccharothrix australiensis]RKT56602.1 L-alanine dehydrogenase [Saccharothrix australiensis]